jgi:hypothetical protein
VDNEKDLAPKAGVPQAAMPFAQRSARESFAKLKMLFSKSVVLENEIRDLPRAKRIPAPRNL